MADRVFNLLIGASLLGAIGLLFWFLAEVVGITETYFWILLILGPIGFLAYALRESYKTENVTHVPSQLDKTDSAVESWKLAQYREFVSFTHELISGAWERFTNPPDNARYSEMQRWSLRLSLFAPDAVLRTWQRFVAHPDKGIASYKLLVIVWDAVRSDCRKGDSGLELSELAAIVTAAAEAYAEFIDDPEQWEPTPEQFAKAQQLLEPATAEEGTPPHDFED